MPRNGYKVVLTADRTLMSDYNGGIFLGFSACFPKGVMPDQLYFTLFCPPIPANKDGSAKFAHCGTRTVEAILLDNGFSSDEVIVAHPEHLNKVIGSNTKVLGLTAEDPLGIGPATSTFTQLLGGEAYMAIKFRELLNHPYIKKYRPKVIVGGSGTWQLEDKEVRRRLGIDCVVIGEGERIVPRLFREAVDGKLIPSVVYGEAAEPNEVPNIRNPTINGIVEIARGCGKGCEFCSLASSRFRSYPLEHILKNIEVNIRSGRSTPILHAEDVLRYKSKGVEINREAVAELFKTVKSLPGIEFVDVSHFTVSSIKSAPNLIEEISNILDLGGEQIFLGGQVGIETGSPKLIQKLMPGKCTPFKTEDWPSLVIESFEILSKNYWVPAATLMLGLPGETLKDVELSIELVKGLRKFKSLIVPLFFVPTGTFKGKEVFDFGKLTQSHKELMKVCWQHNSDWTLQLYDEYAKMYIKNKIRRAAIRRFIKLFSLKLLKIIK